MMPVPENQLFPPPSRPLPHFCPCVPRVHYGSDASLGTWIEVTFIPWTPGRGWNGRWCAAPRFREAQGWRKPTAAAKDPELLWRPTEDGISPSFNTSVGALGVAPSTW